MMEFNLQPIIQIISPKEKNSRVPIEVKYVCELPVFEPGYNFEESGNSTINAASEWDAVLTFLRLYKVAPTLKTYSIEVEKFILWLLTIKRMPLSGLKRDDWHEYIVYLENPPLKHSGKRCKRFNDDGTPNSDWRPFAESEARPAVKTVTKSMKVIEALFRFLVDAGYLKASPVVSSRRRNETVAERAVEVAERFVPQELLDLVIDNLALQIRRADFENQNRSTIPTLHRSNFIIQLLRDTGLRASELISIRMSDIEISDKTEKWRLKVLGKGNKLRRIAIPDRLRETIIENRLLSGLSPYPAYDDESPLVSKLQDARKPITTRRLGQLISDAFSLVANDMMESANKLDTHSKERGLLERQASLLKSVSPHWLRHSHATEYLKESNSLTGTRDRLGHSNLNVTSIYVHTDVDSEDFF
jgi:site-specific recombinase XerD